MFVYGESLDHWSWMLSQIFKIKNGRSNVKDEKCEKCIDFCKNQSLGIFFDADSESLVRFSKLKMADENLQTESLYMLMKEVFFNH